MRRSPILAVAAPVLLLLAGMGFQNVAPVGEPQVFDPAAIVSVEGEVLAVTEADTGSGNGVHLLVRDDDGQELEVRVGPAQYLAQQGIRLDVGDRVEVRGVAMQIDGAAAFVAAAIVRGEDSWVLRDEAGQPAWARGAMLGADGAGARAGAGCMMGGQGAMMGNGRGMGMHHGQGAGAMRGGAATRGRGMGQGAEMGSGAGMQGQQRMQGCGGMQAGAQTADGAPMCRRDEGAATETSALPTVPATASGCQCGCAMGSEAQR